MSVHDTANHIARMLFLVWCLWRAAARIHWQPILSAIGAAMRAGPV